jgi:hypothetical protein
LYLIIAVDYGTSLPDMIKAGRYDWVNPNITPEKFPVEWTGTKAFHTKLFAFGRDISSDDAVAGMRSEGFTPASHVHGLAFGAAFPEEQRKYPIACLGSSAQVRGALHVVYLYRHVDERSLSLSDWRGGWHDSWRFLGIREVSDP